MALWGGRFTQAADQRFKQFNDSLRFDYRLAEQDIVGSVAWSKALVTVGVLTAEEQQQLEEALNNLLEEVRLDPQQILQSDAEDIHSWVEGKLIDKVGQLGKKLHTGRSRNDQVATDLKLWCKDTVAELLAANRQLQSALVETAQNNQDAVMPGYTHLQRAQPVTFAHWCLAYVEMLARDESRLQDTLKRLDVSPLGSGALAGPATVHAVYPLTHRRPTFGLHNMIEPQSLTLLRAKGFTDAHIARRHASLKHQVVKRVIAPACFRKPGPDIGGFPVIKRIDIPGVPAGGDGGPGFVIGKALLSCVGDCQKAIVGFIGTNADHHCCRALFGKPVGKFANKGLEGHAGLVEREVIGIGYRLFRGRAYPVFTRLPALPFGLEL